MCANSAPVACVEEEHVSQSAQEQVQNGACNALLWRTEALLLDTWKVSVWKTLNSLTGPPRIRIRTKEKEFPLENMEELADSQDPDRSGCPGARGFRTPTGQQTTQLARVQARGPVNSSRHRPHPECSSPRCPSPLLLCLPSLQLPKQVPDPDAHLLSHLQSSTTLYLSVPYCPLPCVPGKATGLQTRLPLLPPSPHLPRCCQMGYRAFPGSSDFPQAGTMCTLG